ncbi:DUF3080 domain-containing protein [Pseudomaricurvus alcaniphilus]|uniref:DUF3080 family protein n=1 Tax=Pseudomaricurvus alcaniphilus TaxID=1166482 RepID=UPI00140E739F|nr:DUF3080 family protein [Pseudomaricurvus alcaniphilus]NHN36979.1 DUF3080 domain-containing protein [Pseudomaricurvus alcaniphilus]
MQSIRSFKVIAVLLLASCFLLACERQPDAGEMLARYDYRLGNALELAAGERGAPPPGVEVIELPRYPQRRDLLQPLQPLNIGLLDFLRLSDCDLQRLLGERNSVLGKVMAGSQQLLYHHQFIRLAELCLATLAQDTGRSDLHEALELALRAKRQDSVNIGWNATAASAEFRQLFSLADGPLLPATAALKPTELLVSLQQLARMLAITEPLQSSELEAYYQVVGSANIAGRLLLSQQLVAVHLDRLTARVEAELDRRPLCYRAAPSPRARVAEQVFLRFYIGEVQPYISAVHQQSVSLGAALETLLEPYRPWPDPFARYWQLTWSSQNQASVWRRFQSAVSEHTQLWQKMLRQCGMSPGATQSG